MVETTRAKDGKWAASDLPEAGAPEIEVTPSMIEEGASVIACYSAREDIPTENCRQCFFGNDAGKTLGKWRTDIRSGWCLRLRPWLRLSHLMRVDTIITAATNLLMIFAANKFRRRWLLDWLKINQRRITIPDADAVQKLGFIARNPCDKPLAIFQTWHWLFDNARLKLRAIP